MNKNKNPAPRANAGNRANSKVEQHQIIARVIGKPTRRPVGLQGTLLCRRRWRAS